LLVISRRGCGRGGLDELGCVLVAAAARPGDVIAGVQQGDFAGEFPCRGKWKWYPRGAALVTTSDGVPR
jgi:hypothetical protein